MPYFLKLRRRNFDEIAVTLPAFLHAQGIRQVMAPLVTRSHTLWMHAHGFDPFFAGTTGFEVALSKAQWTAFGKAMKAFIRAAAPRTLWLPPALLTPFPTNKEHKPVASSPTVQGPVGRKASVTFGNLADIGKALRAARKARREDLEQQAESLQSPMFDL